MPVYNGEDFIETAIQSILNQAFRDFEFLILNDGSNDKTLEIINKYSQKDNRIKIINQNNVGLTKSLNTCINLSQGAYIARQDADDISVNSRFEKQVYFLRKEKYDFCCSRTYVKIQRQFRPDIYTICRLNLRCCFAILLFMAHGCLRKVLLTRLGCMMNL